MVQTILQHSNFPALAELSEHHSLEHSTAVNCNEHISPTTVRINLLHCSLSTQLHLRFLATVKRELMFAKNLKCSCVLQFSAIFLRYLVPWPSTDIHRKIYGDRPRGTPPLGELNPRGVAKYSDFGPIESYISETVQDRR